jgi:hypothetical protein
MHGLKPRVDGVVGIKPGLDGLKIRVAFPGLARRSRLRFGAQPRREHLERRIRRHEILQGGAGGAHAASDENGTADRKLPHLGMLLQPLLGP